MRVTKITAPARDNLLCGRTTATYSRTHANDDLVARHWLLLRGDGKAVSDLCLHLKMKGPNLMAKARESE